MPLRSTRGDLRTRRLTPTNTVRRGRSIRADGRVRHERLGVGRPAIDPVRLGGKLGSRGRGVGDAVEVSLARAEIEPPPPDRGRRLDTPLEPHLPQQRRRELRGFVNAVFARNFDQITFVPTFILTPMTYLGGVFYSIAMLPDWAQSLSRANPILYMVNAFRYGFLGHSDVDVGFSFAIMVAAVGVMFGASVWLMEKGTGTRE